MSTVAVSRKQAITIFAVVALALLMSSIDSTIVSVALPTLLVDLKTNLALVAWVMTGYMFSQGIIMPIAGKLSDDIGRKRLFMVAVVVFSLSSLAAGLAPNIFWLIVFRIIQGIGGGAFMPSATGIISDAFGERRNTAIGLFGSIFPIGGIIGPNLGGFIVDHFSWRWIFFVNVPIGLALLISGLFILPGGVRKVVASKQKIDLTGVGLFVGGVFSVLYAITSWANNPAGFGIETWGLFALGLILFYLFTRHEDRTPQPMLDMKLLRWRPFLAVNIYNFIFGAAVFGVSSFIPYYASLAYKMTAEQNGILLTPRSLAMIAASTFTSVYVIRFRYRAPMIAGIIIIALSLVFLSRGYNNITVFGVTVSNIVMLGSLVAVWGVGMGVANPASNNAALDLIPEKVAAVAGTRGMFRFVGGVMGTAVVTLLLSYSVDKVAGMRHIYVGFVLVLLALIPLVFLIPDTARTRSIKRDRDAKKAHQKD